MWYVFDVCLLFYYCIYWTSSLLINFSICAKNEFEYVLFHYVFYNDHHGHQKVIPKIPIYVTCTKLAN